MSSQQYEARDVLRILGISRNRLFYWTKSHRLLVPEVAEAAGTGRRAQFSQKNLVELAFIQGLVDFGTDLRTIRIIKGILDAPYSKLGEQNVFDFALRTTFKEHFRLLLYRVSKTEFVAKVDAVFEAMEAEYDKDGGIHPAPGRDEFFLNYDGEESRLPHYVMLQIDLGRIAQETIKKADGA